MFTFCAEFNLIKLPKKFLTKNNGKYVKKKNESTNLPKIFSFNFLNKTEDNRINLIVKN